MEPDPIAPPPAKINGEPLCDERGPIPTFPSAKLDENGRLIYPSPEERQARSDAIRRLLKVLREQPPDDDPDSFEEFMRAMDSHRPEGMKLFEGSLTPWASLVPLDSGPLGMVCYNPGRPTPDRCIAWLGRLEASGTTIVVPAISDNEVRRELIRIGATARLRNLDALRLRFGFLDITREALEKAAEFWATLRQAGMPTAGDEALDADAILAGMAATIGQPGDSVVVATTNVNHLARFPSMNAQQWESIV